jgi:uncharacterized membrane protein
MKSAKVLLILFIAMLLAAAGCKVSFTSSGTTIKATNKSVAPTTTAAKSVAATTASTRAGEITTKAGPGTATTAASKAYPVLGNWKIVVTRTDGTLREGIFLFEGLDNKGKVTNGVDYEGNFTVGSGINVKPAYGDDKMAGVFIDQDHMSGNIVSDSTGKERGTWKATRDQSITIDMRGDWQLIETYASGAPLITYINFGSGVSGSVASSMVNGSCKTRDYYVKYAVRDGNLIMENNNASRPIKYEGRIVDQNKIEGVFYEYGKQAATFLLLRKLA